MKAYKFGSGEKLPPESQRVTFLCMLRVYDCILAVNYCSLLHFSVVKSILERRTSFSTFLKELKLIGYGRHGKIFYHFNLHCGCTYDSIFRHDFQNKSKFTKESFPMVGKILPLIRHLTSSYGRPKCCQILFMEMNDLVMS